MPSISAALIVFAAALFLALHLWRAAADVRALRWLAALALYASVQALLLSLRWDYGFTALRMPQVLMASALPPLSWLAFRPFWQAGAPSWRELLLHALPVLGCAVVLAVLPDALDGLIIATFAIYGVAFLRLTLADESIFNMAALGGVFDLRRALALITTMLFGSVLVDVAVFANFVIGGGERAALLIGLGNIAWLVLLGASIVLGRRAVVEEDKGVEAPEAPAAADQQIAKRVQSLLTEGGLAKEPGLTLSRLARRAGLPMRQVSQAINRVHGRNVSQYVNDIRVAEACRLMRETDLSITQVIYDSGFQTKSNFNREFLRVTDKTPREWRGSK
jgi:AraC-like DNA-binding protein